MATLCLADEAPIARPTAIPAGPLGQALQTLARERDLQVAYAADEVDPLTTLGASGELTIDETLTQLLRNTGLTFRHTGANGISILPAGPAKTVAPGPEKRPRPAPQADPSSPGAAATDSGREHSGATSQGVAQQSPALQEVQITAQRRTENLQNVPIAATAYLGTDLAGKAVSQLNDLQYAVPSLSIGNAGLSNVVNIRGVGLASGSPAVANGVAVYVDGLFQTPTIYANQFYDIADVEVLRGPQGTLVGTNSTGGGIFINSRNPALGKVAGYVEVGGGSYDAWSTQAAVNVPLNEVLALRIAAEFTQHDSFYRSVGPAYTDSGSLYEKGLRLGLLLQPGPLQVLAKLEYVDRDTGGYAATAVPGTRYAPFAPADPFVLDYDTPGNLNHEREFTLNLQVRYAFANGIALRSQSGYIDKPVHNFEDYDGSAINTPAAPRLTYDQHVRGQHWTQEINLLSPQRGRYDWVAGAYLARSNINVNIYETGALGPAGPTQYVYNPEKKTTTGWFGQLNIQLARAWQLQTGLRYSTYSVTGNGFISLVQPSSACITSALPLAPWNGCKVGSTAGQESDARVTGKVALSYTLNDDNLLYAFIARGYKPGGFNSPTAPFGPETVWDYELGWKATLLQNHLRIQTGGFLYRYQNFQFQELQLSTGTSGVTNLPAATLGGIETSLQARLGRWGIDAGLAYVHSDLPSPQPFINNHLLPPSASNLPQCPPGVSAATGCFDYTPYMTSAPSGPSLYAPQWTFNTGVQYELHLGNAVTLTPRLNYAYVGGQFTSLTYSRVTDYLPAHGLLAALLTLSLAGHWNIEAFGSNLTNELYRTGEGLNSGNYYFYGAPRQYGIRVKYDLR